MNRNSTKNSSSDTEPPSTSYQGVHPGEEGLVYSHSEFSLGTPCAGPIISQQCLPGPTDGGVSDEDLCDEVVVSHTRLSLVAEQAKQAKQARQAKWAKQKRLYVDLDKRVGTVAAANVALRGGEEDATRQSVERLMSRAAKQERIVRLQRTAFGCPLSTCQMVLNATSCLAHCLEEHPTVAMLPMRANITASLLLQLPLVLGTCGSQRCIGMLLFESARQSGLNFDLAPHNEGWNSALAVMVLLWKTSWDAQIYGPMVTHLYNLWFFCPQAHPSLQILISAESQIRSQPGGLKQAKQFKQFKQEVKQQLVPTSADPMLYEQRAMQRENEHYMRFTHREMKLLTNNFTTDVDLKLTIHEEQTNLNDQQHQQDQQNTPEDAIEEEKPLDLQQDQDSEGIEEEKSMDTEDQAIMPLCHDAIKEEKPLDLQQDQDSEGIEEEKSMDTEDQAITSNRTQTSSDNLVEAVEDPLQSQSQSQSNPELEDESVQGTLKIIDSMADELMSGFVDFEKYNLGTEFVKAIKSQAVLEKVRSRSVSVSVSASVSETQLALPSEEIPSLAVLEESQSKSSEKTPSLASVVEGVQPSLEIQEEVQETLSQTQTQLEEEPLSQQLEDTEDLQPQQEVAPSAVEDQDQEDLVENYVKELLDELVGEHRLETTESQESL